MRVAALHYELPPELIAQRPAEERELARLLAVPRGEGEPGHRRVSELPELLAPGTLVVVNDTRVIPARLLGRKRETGGRVEVLLVRRVGMRDLEVAPEEIRSVEVWRALGKASKPLKFGADVEVTRPGMEGGPAAIVVRLLGRADDDGLLEVGLWTPGGEPVDAAVRACGHVPLPPYIKREDEPFDADRYQTVYARHDGAVAAPTAGLHVTNALLGRLAVRGCDVASVTLHVGLGTFQPVTVEDLDQHAMHAERYVVSQSTADAIAQARARGAEVVAVGTTTVRALESAADPDRPGHVLAGAAETRLLVQPGYSWRVVDGLLTNFHLPRSTLLALVAAFAGTERVLEAYRLAVAQRYRFFSYGDAMLLWRAAHGAPGGARAEGTERVERVEGTDGTEGVEAAV
ncbi:MAG TPA: tRNA preQ1(34) S-adenosylmethionine ribosyltransferase-isomerase QueA [Polyangiaceae bacterium]|jgi:S-adenosylmethionine:tRNA ribosyltransferase-isomerase